MQAVWEKAKRILLATYLVFVHVLLLYFVGDAVLRKYSRFEPVATDSVADLERSTPIPTPVPVPEEFADAANANENTNANLSVPPRASTGPGLIIPVVGVKPEQLTDTFSDSRSEGRFHDAIDIMAPQGTPVVAAADGEIVKFWDSERGGITIYQQTVDKKFILYYAHLQKRADGIAVGTRVQKGTTIGYVGDTGNSGVGNFHLHFSISIVTDPKRFWDGTSINPYPFLRNGQYPH